MYSKHGNACTIVRLVESVASWKVGIRKYCMPTTSKDFEATWMLLWSSGIKVGEFICQFLLRVFAKVPSWSVHDENAKVTKLQVAGCVFSKYVIINVSCYIHDVTPKVVAIAVRIVMAMWMIFCQISCLFMILIYDFWFMIFFTTDYISCHPFPILVILASILSFWV